MVSRILIRSACGSGVQSLMHPGGCLMPVDCSMVLLMCSCIKMLPMIGLQNVLLPSWTVHIIYYLICTCNN